MALHPEVKNAPPEERRSFLGIVSGLIAAGISAVLGINLGRFTLGPAFSGSSDAAWTEAGALTDLPDGKLTKRNLVIAQEAGWGKFIGERSVWVIKRGEEVKVFSAVCPHLGCSVNAKDAGFLCACHNSLFDESGKLLSGPSPRSLDTLEYKVESGKLKVRYQNFKQGIPAKEVIS